MNLLKYLIISLVYLMAIEVKTYNILGVFPLAFRSHNIFFQALMQGLAKQGHQVDVISHYELKDPPKTYRTILNLKDVKFLHLKKLKVVKNASQTFKDPVLLAMDEYGNKICELLSVDQMQKIIKDSSQKDRKYDLIITEGLGISCFYVLGHLFKVPLMTVIPSLELPWISRNLGNPLSTAFYPTFTISKSEIKTFWERLQNTLQSHIFTNTFFAYTGKNQTKQLQQYFGQDMPTIRELERNVALCLVNTHYTIQGVRPTTPAFIEIGGLHIEEDNSMLTTELKQWMDESKHGVVYFSLGTSVSPEILSKKTISSIHASLAKLAPVRVLMKISEKYEIPTGLSKNVLLKRWLPQIPVLSHNNTKVFITQGGALSIQEAIYFGVPVIGIPVFFDQNQNIKIMVKKNMGIYLNYKEITEKSLDKALRTILTESKYRKAAKYQSYLFRDRPLSPMSTAVYWIEYIIRNGPEILRSPAVDMYWWQVELLDVYGFLLLFSLLILYISLTIVKATFRKIFRKNTKSNLKME